MCHICCYGCVRKNILRKHIITKHGPDSLPPDMVFKRGYPPLQEAQPEEEEEEEEAKLIPQGQGQVEQKVPTEHHHQQPITMQSLKQQQQPITVQSIQQQQQQQPITVQHQHVVPEQRVAMEPARQTVHITNAAIITTSADAPFSNAGLSVAVNHQQAHLETPGTLTTSESRETIQPMAVADLNRSQSRENAQTVVAMENVTSPQGHASLDNSASPHPPLANQMAGQLYGMIRHPVQQQEQTLPVSTQSADNLQTAVPHQPMTPLFSHSQQPIGNQPGYAEYSGYLNSSQMSLIQQMYLQTYNTSNMPQQQ